jgi:nitrile hydratase
MHNEHDHQAHAEPEPPHYGKRAQAIQALLVEKGILTADEVRRQIDDMDSRTPALGARVAARAWVDPAFRARLLADAKAACAELGIDTGFLEAALVVVENTETVHHVVVCTLCSCYPRAILGIPPEWYKSLNYRTRVVADPRGVLREFGLELGPDVEVRVLDSTADMRYLVIPQRPAGTERLSEEEMARLVTRDSMIGVAKARTPDRP